MAGKCPDIDTVDLAEAYSLAITIEEEGYQFYEKMIGNIEKVQAKNELEYLKNEEKKHKAIFEKLLKESGAEFTKDESSDLHCWVDENLIQPMKEAVEKNIPQSSHEALRIGVILEDKSIELFSQLKNATDDKAGVKAIKDIIKEEKKHKKRLNIILAY